MHILGVRIDPLKRSEMKEKLRIFFSDGLQHMIATPNPEMLVLASQNAEFRSILNNTDLNIPDGFGLKLAAFFSGEKIPERITGVDLVEMLCSLASENGKKVYFLGGEDGVGERAAVKLCEKYSSLEIFADSGGTIRQMANPVAEQVRYGVGGKWQMVESVADKIIDIKPEVLIVALGHGKQETWINDNLKDFPSVKIAVGVGGALDYFSGKIKRAPRFIQKIGLEWLWRLLHEPRRLGRIINAVIIFPLLIIRNALRPKF